MEPSAAWEPAEQRVQFGMWTAHLRDLGSPASAPRAAQQSPGRRQKPSRSKDDSHDFDLPIVATQAKRSAKGGSLGEVLSPSKRLIGDFVHRRAASCREKPHNGLSHRCWRYANANLYGVPGTNGRIR